MGEAVTEQLETQVPTDGQREARLQETDSKREMDGRWCPRRPQGSGTVVAMSAAPTGLGSGRGPPPQGSVAGGAGL